MASQSSPLAAACLSVSTACPLSSLPVFPLNGNDKAGKCTPTHTLSPDYTSRPELNSAVPLSCREINMLNYAKSVRPITHGRVTIWNQVAGWWCAWAPQILVCTGCVSVIVRQLVTGRHSNAAASGAAESLGRPLKAHRVLRVGSLKT